MDLAAQADHSGSTRHLDQKALNPGHPAEAPKRRHGVDFLEKRVHPKPFGGPQLPSMRRILRLRI
jgi:hypothetical protein